MWAIEDSPGPKAAYRGGWYHFEPGYTTDGDWQVVECLQHMHIQSHQHS